MENVKKLLEDQKKYLNYYFEKIDQDQLETVISACEKVTGLLVLTGVGKSGIIAEKIAMTLISTGTRAIYLPPMNFLHGDIGVLSKEDLLIMISRSGETEELVTLLPFIKQKGTQIIAVVSTSQSQLAKKVDRTLVLPVEKELCPFDLAPTTSTAVQMLFGDLLAVALMERKNFSMDEYALNHPAGSLGKKMTVKVEDLMFRDQEVPLCHPDDKLVDLLVELSNKKCGALIVVGEKRELLGIFTDGDLRRALQQKGSNVLSLSIKELMSASPIFVDKGMLASEALRVMQGDPKKFVAVVPVLDESGVVGILRMHDIVQRGIV